MYFIRSSFLLGNSQYTHNHRAISTLLATDQAKACLTTNYDNALENALLGVDCENYSHPKHPGLSTFLAKRCLLKLHGDSANPTVATLSDMFEAEYSNQHNYLETLLAGKTILVVGYSGFGDIDISPQLSNLASNYNCKFIWMNKRKNNEIIPNYASACVGSDLSSMGDENYLLRLAKRYGYKDNSSEEFPSWESNLDIWIQTQKPAHLNRILIAEMIEARLGWPIFHIYHVSKWTNNWKSLVKDKRELLELKILASHNTPTYVTAIKALSRYKELLTKTDKAKIAEVTFRKGFIEWRMGNHLSALDLLQGFVKDKRFYPPAHANLQVRKVVVRGLRIYLEVAADRMSFDLPQNCRYQFAKNYELEDVGKQLLAAYDKNLSNERIDFFLSKIAVMNVSYLLNSKVIKEDVIDIYSQTKAIQQWMVAAYAARLLAYISPAQSITRLVESFRQLRLQGLMNHAIKNIGPLLYACFRVKVLIRIPLILEKDGFPFAKVKIQVMEFIYRARFRRWRHAYVKSLTKH